MHRKSVIFLMLLSVFVGCSKQKTSKQAVVKNIALDIGDYSVNTLASGIDWIGKELSTKTHTGTLKVKSGDINIDSMGNIEGVIQIDMQTIVVTDLKGGSKQKLEGHLRSKDFFGVQDNPLALISFRGDTRNVVGNILKVKGNLEIKNISHPIEFETEIDVEKNNLMVTARMSFDRSKYNVKFRSGTFFKNLGDKLILNDIDVKTTIIAEKS